HDTLQPTTLASAPVLTVSSETGEGIEALRSALIAAAGAHRPDHAKGHFRLAVDRCFSLSGAGTIVTGAVMAGEVQVGDSVTVSPGGLKARVRSIHAQNRAAERGVVGERCALNLTGEGVSRHAIARGDVVVDPMVHAPTARIDAEFRLLAGERRPLAHWTPARLHHAAVEVAARVALLADVPIGPGEQGRVQLVLDRPIAGAAHDRFILRDTSGARTIGGGRFLDLRAPQRRRRTPARLAQLDALAESDAAVALATALERWPFFVDIGLFARDRGLGDTETRRMLDEVAQVRVTGGEGAFLLAPIIWARLTQSARAAVAAYHAAHPDLLGLSALRMARTLEPRLPIPVADAVVRALIERGVLASEAGAVRSPEHRFGLDAGDEALWVRIRPLLSDKERFRPPRVVDLAGSLGAPEAEVRRVLKSLARQKTVAEVVSDHFFLSAAVSEMAAVAVDIAGEQPDGQISAAQFRDRLDNGRKVAIQILEYFDRHGLTLRRGDLRRIDPRRLEQFRSAAMETS
ncbi:MAG TPA: SelB C-terminal domain-containing protein, partial [Caulobacteraceae bacterium]